MLALEQPPNQAQIRTWRRSVYRSFSEGPVPLLPGKSFTESTLSEDLYLVARLSNFLQIFTPIQWLSCLHARSTVTFGGPVVMLMQHNAVHMWYSYDETAGSRAPGLLFWHENESSGYMDLARFSCLVGQANFLSVQQMFFSQSFAVMRSSTLWASPATPPPSSISQHPSLRSESSAALINSRLTGQLSLTCCLTWH